MDDLLFARWQMAVSLGFHIIFAVVGIGMPLLMAISEAFYLRTKRELYLELAKRWAKGTAILFAVGAVSGTVLSFELGLLWPTFMEYAGGIIGMPFSLEGFAFFTEAIFLGIYLYGWKRIPPLAHWFAGVMVALSGMLSGVFVVTANAWMNAPTGFEIVDGQVVSVDPIAAMLNPASLQQVIHMTIAAYVATGFAVAAVHAFYLLRNPAAEFHRSALRIALAVAAVATPLQLVSGDRIAQMVARTQPVKFAALEAHYETSTRAPLIVGGVPDDDRREVKFGLRIPGVLSFLAHHDFNAKVVGLAEFPREDWPNVRLVHWAFDLMVFLGVAMLVPALWTGVLVMRRRDPTHNRRLLRTLVLMGPAGFLAIEAGWCVTELGRQPWIIYGIMRTKDAVTPMPGLVVTFTTFTLVYLFLSAVVIYLLRRQFIAAPETTGSRAGAPAAADDREAGA